VIVAEVFAHRGTQPKTIKFNTLQLRFSSSNDWNDAKWEFISDTSTNRFATSKIEEICSKSSNFEIKLFDGSGRSMGSFLIQAVLCGYPTHSFCFLFRADEDGMWSGHTVAKSFGQIVVVAHRFDPS
jgi:hypothetical protein